MTDTFKEMKLAIRGGTASRFTTICASLVLGAVATVAVVAGVTDEVDLHSAQYTTGDHSYALTDVVWDNATNKVSGVLVLESNAVISSLTPVTFQIGTYDDTAVPLTVSSIQKHTISVTPTLDSTGKKLSWTFTDFQMPQDEKFAGVYVSGGTYLSRSGPSAKTRIVEMTLAFAHNQW